MATKTICDIEPFRYQSTPQPEAESGASGSEINQQAIEDYLNRLREAICADIESIVDECCDGGGGGGASEFTELTDTPSSYAGDGGLIVQVKGDESGLEFASAGGGGADSDGLALDYSTSEQATNRTWVGGETIYQKTINFGALPNGGAKSVAHGISNLDRVITYEAIAYNSSSGNQLPLPHATTTSLTTAQIQFNINSTNVLITTGNDRTAYNAYVTLFYLKSS